LIMTALVAVATLMAPSGARADQTSDQRDATRRKKSSVQSELDLARASDVKVEAEVSRLSNELSAQQARAEAARQAAAAAQAEVERANRQLAETESRAATARQLLAKRAVAAYVHPNGQGGLVGAMGTTSLQEAGRREAMLNLVQSNTTELIGVLRATREDQADAAKALQQARAAVTARAGAETKQAAVLRESQQVQQRVHDELQGRIAHLQQESQILAAQEGQLQALLKARTASVSTPAAAAARPADAPAPRAPRAATGGFIWPVDGPVTSEFGPRWGSFHPGIDIADPEGTPISASKTGTVVFAGPNGGYGNFVIIDHGDGTATAYAHQSRIGSSEGEHVSQGQTIGYVGSTGFSTGNHLHFEIRVNGSAVNPRNYLGG
jgi:murein DD-endopeptidase MepM/ murein hydrolase activator NlpD